MLPSKGYFSGVPCVFFSDGGCKRPHCHYRHSHQDVISGNVGQETQNARPLTEPSSRTGFTKQNVDFIGWSPEQVTLVSKLVEKAVDKALLSDPTEIPRGALVKNTLDKIFADPDALEMASKRKSSLQAESVPAYKPTPISKLTQHIPVLCVPEKPYSSLTKTRTNIKTDSSGIVTNLMQNVSSEPKPSMNFHLADNEPLRKNTTTRKLNTPLKLNSKEPKSNVHEDLSLNNGFYRNTDDTGLMEDTRYPAQLGKFSMKCTIPLKRLSAAEVDRYSRTRNNEETPVLKASSKCETESSKKAKLTMHHDSSPSRDTNSIETDFGPMLPTSALPIPVMPDKQNISIPVADAHAVGGNLKFTGISSLKNSKDCCGPPAKKKKSESRNDCVTLQVSSTADPFIRWMQNKKIRQILGKDKKPKDSSKSTDPFSRWMQNKKIREILGKEKKPKDLREMPEPKAQKRSLKTPSNTVVRTLEDELPEPKISKRIAHKADQFRPMPIVAEEVKIPSALRHHFCAAFFEEFKKTMDLDDAKRKAPEEELQVAKNSKSAKTYKNNCSLLIVKHRKGNAEDVKMKPVDLTPASCPDFTYGWSLYQSFSSYLLSECELRENGFPLAVPDMPNCAYVDRASRRYTQQPGQPGHKICANCSVEFQVDGNGFPTTRDDCVYHWGKLRRVQHKGQTVDKFTCCGGSVDSGPCEFSVYHVWSGGNEDCLEDFVETKKLPSNAKDHEAGIYALDCEMCYTTKGLELARLTVLDLNGRAVFDEIISMDNPVLNYCTRFSGIDARKTASATRSFDDVRAWVLSHFYDKTILVGHSLENDLKALKLIHRTIVDTSVTFPHKFGPPNKMSLKHLANVVLQMNIQENTDGHDSKEDADTCLKLMMKKIREDSKARKPRVIIGYNGKKN